MSDNTEQPPSFAPQARRKRPRAAGAKHVNTARSRQQPAAASARHDAAARMPAHHEAHAHREAPVRRSVMPPSVPPAAAQMRPVNTHNERRAVPRSAAEERRAARPVTIPPAARTAYGARPAPSPNSSPTPSAHQLARQSGNPQSTAAAASAAKPTRPAKRRKKINKTAVISTLVILLVLAIATPVLWFVHLVNVGNAGLTHVAALSGGTGTTGATYLIVGSDQRSADMAAGGDTTTGMRSDTIMVLHKPTKGTTALISIPRDSWVDIPGEGEAKINAAFAWGGPQLLVQTVEQLTGLTIDHYVQIGMDGVQQLTDAVGGVQLCMEEGGTVDFPVNDPDSGLVWEKPGCEIVDGTKALAFSRMRKADAIGDLGRAQRQRQVVSAILHKALSRDILLSPRKQEQLVKGTASTLTVDDHDSIMDVGFAGLALRDVMSGGSGVSGAPPIATLSFWTRNGQSAVQLDPDRIDDFWRKVADGTVKAEDFYNPLG